MFVLVFVVGGWGRGQPLCVCGDDRAVTVRRPL